MEQELLVVGKHPSHSTDTQIAEFVSMVRRGEEVVDDGLENRIRRTEWLFFLQVDGFLVGVAALKNPSVQHRETIKRDTGIPVEVNDYPYELGYIFVAPEARGQGLSSCLVSAALAASKRVGMFATSRTDNFEMHRTLMKFRFEKAGRIYKSSHRDRDLQLFLLHR